MSLAYFAAGLGVGFCLGAGLFFLCHRRPRPARPEDCIF